MKRRLAGFVVVGLALGLGAFLLAQGVLGQTSIAGGRAAPEVGLRPASDFAVPGKIAFIRGGDIWRWSGGNLKQITRGNAYQVPAWSPDGTRLAAGFLGQNHADIVVVNESGARILQLTHNWSASSIQDQSWARSPAWSRDGGQIAYVSDFGGTDMSLWIVPGGGGNPRRVLTQSRFSAGLDSPTWSPDGESIAFASFTAVPSQIHILNLSSGGVQTVTNQPEGAYDPAWSPDGRFIAYAAREKGKNDVWLLDVAAKTTTRLTQDGAARAPAWSPDGTLIAYLSLNGTDFDLKVAKLNVGTAISISETKTLTKGEPIRAESRVSWAR